MRWLYLHFPALALDTLLAGHPVEGCWALLDDNNQLLQCNDTALATGLRPGMALAEALALCDELQALRLQPAQDQQALQRLAEDCYQLVARIHPDPPRGLWLELAAMARLQGPPATLAAQLTTQLQAQGYRLQAALAPQPWTARLLARAGQWLIDDNELCLTQRLAALPLTHCELDPRQLERLQGWGLQRLGQLLALPRAEVRRRAGAPLAQWLQRLEASAPPSVPAYQPSPVFEDRLTLLYEAEQSEGVLFVLQRQLQRLQLWLRQRQLAAGSLQLELGHRQLPATCLRLASAQPDGIAANWLMLARLQLARQPLLAPVCWLRLRSQTLEPLQAPAIDLWQAASGALSPDQLLSRLQARLNPDQLQGLAARPDHVPEQAGLLVAVGERGGDYGHSGRPLWLLPQPQPLAVPWPLLDGPERLASQWWAEPLQRDYYRALAPDGRPAWLFRTAGGHWFLHGWFG
ncbi:MAG: DNA polymerase Y family protein [Gammaproteobacteria bacterium]|nr:DNA polymerase Y family protein [Gammaproteobacteria bacterium]